jgi:hypothetical protein
MLGDKMEQLLEKARIAWNYLQDHQQPLWKRIHYSLEAYSGLKLSGLPPQIKSEIEGSFVLINAIFNRYEIASFDDYQKIAADDLMEIQRIAKKLSEIILSMA